jgi:hypothetical protein
MTQKLTPEQHVAANIARMSASSQTSTTAAQGMLNASIVWSLAMPAMAMGIATALARAFAATTPPPPPR